MNVLEGKPLRYVIGAPADQLPPGRIGEIMEVPWDCDNVPNVGLSIGYCNLFDEENSGNYGPYLHSSDTAHQYGEGQIDPDGPGFERNVDDQLDRRQTAGFKFVELDNPDAYPLAPNLVAIGMAEKRGLGVVAKNPGLGCFGDPADDIVKHPNVFGIIVEKGAGTPGSMDAMRKKNGKTTLPVWFVFFGRGILRAHNFAPLVKQYRSMFVSYSSVGEYVTATQLI